MVHRTDDQTAKRHLHADIIAVNGQSNCLPLFFCDDRAPDFVLKFLLEDVEAHLLSLRPHRVLSP